MKIRVKFFHWFLQMNRLWPHSLFSLHDEWKRQRWPLWPSKSIWRKAFNNIEPNPITAAFKAYDLFFWQKRKKKKKKDDKAFCVTPSIPKWDQTEILYSQMCSIIFLRYVKCIIILHNNIDVSSILFLFFIFKKYWTHQYCCVKIVQITYLNIFKLIDKFIAMK